MSGEKAPKKQSFLQGVAVLTAATIIVKLLGFIYKVPLQNILQERGFGYFNTAYDVYNVLLMISTTGLPVAVSRMISQAQALENYAQIRKIYSVSMKVFLTIGVIATLVMLVFCKPLSVMVTTNENSWAAIAFFCGVRLRCARCFVLCRRRQRRAREHRHTCGRAHGFPHRQPERAHDHGPCKADGRSRQGRGPPRL